MQTQSAPQEAPRTPKKGGKKLFWIVLIIIIAVAGYFFWKGGLVGAQVAAVVDGEKITEKALMARYEVNKQNVVAQNPNIDFDNEDNVNVLMAQTLDQLINEELILKAATEKGVEVTKSDVKDQVAAIVLRFDDEDAFEEELKKNELTRSSFEDNIRKEMIINEYVVGLGEENNVAVTDDEIVTAYNSAKAQFADLPALEEIKDAIRSELLGQKLVLLRNQEVLRLRDEAEIEIVKEIKVPEQNTQATQVTEDDTADEGSAEEVVDESEEATEETEE